MSQCPRCKQDYSRPRGTVGTMDRFSCIMCHTFFVVQGGPVWPASTMCALARTTAKICYTVPEAHYDAYVMYGKTTGYGDAATGVPSEGPAGAVYTNLTGLTPNTLYHYMVVYQALQSGPETQAPDATFTTLP